MFGRLVRPEYTYRQEPRARGLAPNVREVVRSVSVLPDGIPVDGRLLYARAEDVNFSLDDIKWGGQAFRLNPPRVAFDVVEGRAVNVRLVQVIET